ncbi:hypothetical protein [Natribacillus halophilus]|uniref:Uncharacterized protein n=1 Tax=Natribacillus halophilus TaxID=549003 RepID=A0A1G8R2Z2_9BACI|nr:hypothetical protein [Natribacillus halophilus]SDJ11352.1 hypothetical protein SAMN04488123_11534 [Natribacillus halophilus]
MNKKLLYGVLSGVFAVGMLAACNGGGMDDGGGGQDNGGMEEEGN